MSKNRLAPIKKMSIDRIELCGAVLSKRLKQLMEKESRYRFAKCFHIVDSQIVHAIWSVRNPTDLTPLRPHVLERFRAAEMLKTGTGLQVSKISQIGLLEVRDLRRTMGTVHGKRVRISSDCRRMSGR